MLLVGVGWLAVTAAFDPEFAAACPDHAFAGAGLARLNCQFAATGFAAKLFAVGARDAVWFLVLLEAWRHDNLAGSTSTVKSRRRAPRAKWATARARAVLPNCHA